MTFYSVKFKLFSFVIAAFGITTIVALFIVDSQLTKSLRKSQRATYTEKINSIWKTLEGVEKRILETGLAEAYSEAFMDSIVDDIANTTGVAELDSIYPFIIEDRGSVIFHPVTSKQEAEHESQLIQKYIKGEAGVAYTDDTWYIYRKFSPWKWLVIYRVPLTFKNADINSIRITLIASICALAVVTLAILSLFINKLTKPITVLTSITSQIADGNLKPQINIDVHDEIGILARSFSRMRDSIVDQIDELNSEISMRKETESELSELRNYLADIIDSMPTALIGLDQKGIISQWNRKTTETTGIDGADAVGQNLEAVIPRLGLVKELIQKTIATGSIHTKNRNQYTVDDNIFYEDITIYPLSCGHVKGAVILLDNVSEKVKMEDVMMQTEKLQSIAGLAAGMAHEINNPLAIITQGIQNIQRRLNPEIAKNSEFSNKYDIDIRKLHQFLDERKVLTFLNSGRIAVERAAQIVRNMLMFSRKSDSTSHLTNIADLVEYTINLGASDYDMKKKYDFKFVNIIREFEPDLPEINCCSSEIEQVLLNLFKNSLQAMEVMTDKTFQPKLRIRLGQEGLFLKIEIEDNGPGIPDEVKHRIFEPFFTTKAVGLGTGLGLSVSYSIVTQNHSGTFDVESEVGKYTKFIIRLPLNA